ncbi:MAG TPA: hypothetical protein VFY93_15945 [Planctomycetota bacterium]|nr:hypothetical protein [Planctomycetota bacterium]
MSLRRATLLALVATVAACDSDCCDDNGGLYPYEEAYLAEDVTDLMTNVFATGEHAFDGDAPLPADVTQIADASNQYTAVYLLPDAFRPGLGQGSGDVALQVTEDGVPNVDPLLFSFATTTALAVDLVYDLRYLGFTDGARETDVAFRATLHATRASLADPFVVEYVIGGTAFFGTTYCDFNTRFEAPGPPSAGVYAGGDGAGYIDDPDVIDIFNVDIDYTTDLFGASGPVGCCASYSAAFYYDQLFF